MLGRFGKAFLREMARGGQVFYLYNRVESIERCWQNSVSLSAVARIALRMDR